MFGFSILIFYHYVPHSNMCGAFCFLIKPSIFKASSCLRKKSPPTGGQVKRLPHFLLCDSPLFCTEYIAIEKTVNGPQIRILDFEVRRFYHLDVIIIVCDNKEITCLRKYTIHGWYVSDVLCSCSARAVFALPVFRYICLTWEAYSTLPILRCQCFFS